MERNAGAAARLSQIDRAELAIVALARSEPISDLAVQHGVSRKFVYQQANKARCALDEAFSSATGDDTVLFEIQVTKRWLRQAIVALALMCRSSYLGILEFMRDVLGLAADSNEGGHLFQSDRGHHSNSMAASSVSSRGPVLVMP